MNAIEKQWNRAAKAVCLGMAAMALSACQPFLAEPNTGATILHDPNGGKATIQQTVILPVNSSETTIAEFRYKDPDGPDAVTRIWIEASGAGHLASLNSHSKAVRADFDNRGNMLYFEEDQSSITGAPFHFVIRGPYKPINPTESSIARDIQAFTGYFTAGKQAAIDWQQKVAAGPAANKELPPAVVLCSTWLGGDARVNLIDADGFKSFRVNRHYVQGYVGDRFVSGSGNFDATNFSFSGNHFVNFQVTGASGRVVNSYSNGEENFHGNVYSALPINSPDKVYARQVTERATKLAAAQGCFAENGFLSPENLLLPGRGAVKAPAFLNYEPPIN